MISLKQLKGLLALLFIGSMIPSMISCEESADEKDVVVLTASNFDEVINGTPTALVKFYAPWCGHCMRMAPEYAKAAQILKEKNSPVVIAKVDAVAETSLADQHKIGEFPTIYFFRNQKKEKYTGGRTAEQIVEWIEKMTGPAVAELQSDSELAQKVSAESPNACVLTLRKDASGDEIDAALKAFTSVAEESRQISKFFKIVAADLPSNASNSNFSIEFVRHEEGRIPFEISKSPVDAADLKKFVESESFPLFGPINGDNFWRYNDREKPFVWFCGNAAQFDAHKAVIREAAAVSRAFSFVWLDSEQFKGHAESVLGVSAFPGLVVQTLGNDKDPESAVPPARYIFPGVSKDASNSNSSRSIEKAQDIMDFIKDMEAGKLVKDLKSEPLPDAAENEKAALKVVVGKNFEQVVLDAKKDVFLMVYSPWCVYCKNFEPVYTEFAEKAKGLGLNLTIAKVDGTQNESPIDGFHWNSFPTIFYVKAGQKNPSKFDGSRTLQGLVDFYETNASQPFDKAAFKAGSGGSHDEL